MNLAYADLNDELCLLCAEYSAALSKCTACESNGTHVKCTACGTAGYYFLSSDGTSCL